ncbi:MAG: hypothetical protein KKH44_07970, partial [Bacteroidetes bacterium]|nr:hypothetical protein [Bacteroidota bacterium]
MKNCYLIFAFLLVALSALSQVQVFPGEAPIDEVFERNGNFGPSLNPQGVFSSSFNRARGIISIGAEVQSDGYASWDRLTVHFYYNGQWVPVFQTNNRNRNELYESNVSQNTTSIPDPTKGFHNSDLSTYAYDQGSGTSFRNVHQEYGNGSLVRLNNVYLKNFNNLKLYKDKYLPESTVIADRANNANTANWSLQFDEYTIGKNYPVRNGSNPASNVESGYDVGNFNSAGNIAGIHFVQPDNDRGVMIFNISNLPPEMISAASFKVRIYAHDAANLHSRIIITTYNNQNPMQNAPIGLTASNNVCGKVVLNWSNASNTLPTEETMKLRQVIFRNNVYLDTVSANIATYEDVTALQDSIYNYSIRHVAFSSLGKTYFQSNPSNVVQGNIRPRPDVAVSPVATDNRCNKEVQLTWEYNAGAPKNFIIQRSTNSSTGFTNLIGSPIGGNERLFLDTSAVRGTRYYYKIITVNSCDVLSSGAASISGISPADPALATNVLATYNTSTNKVDVTWTDNANNESRYEIIRQDDLGNTVYFDLNIDDIAYHDDGVST